jgi:hypothetical protein
MARWRENNDGHAVSYALLVKIHDFSSSDSDHKISDAEANENDSGINGSEKAVTMVSSWLYVIDSDPGTYIRI